MHIFLNGLAATAGGGLTYLRNVVPRLAREQDVRTTLLVAPVLDAEFARLPNVELHPWRHHTGIAYRFWQEQKKIPPLIIQSQAELLLSAGNFAVKNSPVPQLLLSRNSLYTSEYFARDLRRRRQYAQLKRFQIESFLAKRSVAWADCTVAPSKAFAGELSEWTHHDVVALHHGFDVGSFSSDQAGLDSAVQSKLTCPEGALRFLFVSHYNYYRNFETLLEAVAQLKHHLKGRAIRLFLTCNLGFGTNPGSYRSESAARLVSKLGIAQEVVELGPVPNHKLHHVYKSADIYVTPAYAESFAHPLVEAMACGLPVVASDLPVHREICGDAAFYFQRFSSEQCATQLARLATDGDHVKNMRRSGLQRSKLYSWDIHVAGLLALAAKLTGKSRDRSPASCQPGRRPPLDVALSLPDNISFLPCAEL